MNEQDLRAAFGDCKRPASSLCPVNTSFEYPEGYSFYVYDNEDNQPISIVESSQDYHLTVRNHTNSPVCIVKTDKCLFTDEHKKCDCILFDAKNLFFVEMKNSAIGSRSANRKKAAIQLGDTIQLFENNNIDFKKHTAKAIICFKTNNTYPTQPSRNTLRAVFLEKYGVSLEEGNEIEF